MHSPQRIVPLFALLLFLFTSAVSGCDPWPCASQVGPSCAFFGNIPALTLHTGVDIASSTEFIRPIYGLHRGDFQFHRSFHKKKFYELFCIPYTSQEISHPAAPREELLASVETMITTTFDPGLQQGQLFSLRSIGAFGGPHNVLLLAKQGDKYQVHDPFPGVIRSFSRAELAKVILIASSKTRRDPQPRYVTHYLTIAKPPTQFQKISTLSSLPNTLQITLTAQQRIHLQQGLRASVSRAAKPSFSDLMASYPSLDFAALPISQSPPKFENAIYQSRKPEELFGLVRLAQFHLNVWQLGHRDHLSVLFLQGTPHALTGYRKTDLGLLLHFDNGSKIIELQGRDVITALAQGEAVHATIRIPQTKRK